MPQPNAPMYRMDVRRDAPVQKNPLRRPNTITTKEAADYLRWVFGPDTNRTSRGAKPGSGTEGQTS